ncbi:MAG: hypothetical protein Q9175_005211 [Cornicularia normoerica]
MSATEPKDFIKFRDTLAKLERLVDVRDNLTGHIITNTGEGINHTLKILTEFDVDTSEPNAFEELERLAIMKEKTAFQTRTYCSYPGDPLSKLDIDTKRAFDKIMDSKIDFIKKDASSRLDSTRSVEPMATLERLAEVQKKYQSRGMDDLLAFKIKEVVYTPEPTPLTQCTTVSSANVVAVPVCVSPNFPRLAGILVDKVPQAFQKQEISRHDIPRKCNESKTTPKFITSHLSWVQDQNKVRIKLYTEDDDDSTEDWGELTPTSTIMSGQLESTD